MGDAPARKRSSAKRKRSRKTSSSSTRPPASSSSSSSVALTGPLQQTLDQVKAGDKLPDDRSTQARLFTLKRRGLIERERVDGVDRWTVAGKTSG